MQFEQLILMQVVLCQNPAGCLPSFDAQLPFETDQFSQWMMLGVGAQNYVGETDSVVIESVRFYAPNVCSQPCQNNATCIGVDQCFCQPGWTGQWCENAICTDACNPIGGNCTAPDTCSCYYGWTDSLCNTRKSLHNPLISSTHFV